MAGIVLIGLPGSGKTTIARAVAAELGLDFIDTDALVEARSGRTIAQIFAEEGETRFRELELQACADALDGDAVVSLGGGAVTNPAIRAMIRRRRVIWLDVCVADLAARLGIDQARPLLLGDLEAQLNKLAGERLELYQEAATYRVDAEGPVADVVIRVLACLNRAVVRVDSDHPYDVVIGPGVSSAAAAHFDGVARTAVLHPPVLAGAVARLARPWPSPLLIEVPDGEAAKTVTVLADCWSRLARAGLTRSDAVIGVGGGATTDLAGFVAATYLRGIGYLNLPTTVLGMADAGLGGKTGINLGEGKNLVGAFWEPRAVLCDLDFLVGLPSEEVKSGLAEIIKCGFIADEAILDLVRAYPEAVADTTSRQFFDALTRAVRVKADVVARDFREQADESQIGREALNYGHTLGHAIEKLEGFAWAHGFADSVGMVFAAEVAHGLGLITRAEVDEHRLILQAVGLPLTYSGADWASLRATMSLDKKARGSRLRMVLLEGAGRPRVVADPDEAVLARAYEAISG